MRDMLPAAQLADLLASFTPSIDPAGPEWSDLCSALDAYDRAAQLGLDLDEARYQVDTAAMILHLWFSSIDPQRHSGVHEHQTVR
ncbi:hypothetical protein [Frankia sp. EI5c]|uniref:hypothetical protein n=1 Tax=Frankia sp. EI5c TaxID=683316 RepID=UPI0018FE2D96|nr:hypothetical protein [Frankia sp. EI5c]